MNREDFADQVRETFSPKLFPAEAEALADDLNSGSPDLGPRMERLMGQYRTERFSPEYLITALDHGHVYSIRENSERCLRMGELIGRWKDMQTPDPLATAVSLVIQEEELAR